jgi:4-diphosphocytidyl-2-C-methyl-D-erythritol kinase
MIRLLAPAKLNLYLRVLGRRADNFHELDTLFERIDLSDELTFESAPALSLTCDHPTLSCGEENLILKAARLLQRTTATGQSARIHLTKRIPIAAGLGGGSSDAATTLLGLNELWQLSLSHEALLTLGAELGSDVCFFLTDAPFAIGRGRGELCEPVLTECRLAHVVVSPPASLSTKEIFEAWDRTGFNLTVSTSSSTIRAHALCNGSLGELAKGLGNDLEPEAIRRCPVIAVIRSQLRESGCLATLMTGSGPSVFGLCRDRAHAQEIADHLTRRADPSWRIEVVQTMRPAGCMTPNTRS